MKYVIAGTVAVLVGIGALVFFMGAPGESKEKATIEEDTTAFTGTEHSILLTPEGYKPSEITITVGDKITFGTSEVYGNLHWPASNLHPSHDIYPAFDPLRPIEPGTTWSFVFGKRGEWRFHDHLAPYHTGAIIVQ